MTTRAVIAAGSNLGDRAAILQRGLRALAAHERVAVFAVSPVYETEPVGGPAQGPFLNLVALVDTDLAAPELLALLHAVEAAADRERLERWGPRTLDLDLIAFGDETSAGALELPHPRAHERAFVLVPWAALDPDAVLPGRGRVAELLAAIGTAGVRPAAAEVSVP